MRFSAMRSPAELNGGIPMAPYFAYWSAHPQIGYFTRLLSYGEPTSHSPMTQGDTVQVYRQTERGLSVPVASSV